jgi:choline dehydrogenase-like flavoprotein
LDRALAETTGLNPSRHGFKGWLQTEKAIPEEALGDGDLLHTLAASALKAFNEIGHPLEEIADLIDSQLDPNDWRVVTKSAAGLRYTPLMTRNHQRSGTRERLLDVASRRPLHIEMDALATEVLFEEGTTRAVGIRYLKGSRLYRAFNPPEGGPGRPCEVRATREVILAGGAFNTPQLLMLSGIGPREQLERHGIQVRADLAGVGRNLQDRYEIPVINRMNFKSWDAFKGAHFDTADPQFQEWKKQRGGVYSTNGSVLTVFRRSPVAGPLPDLFCMALLARFAGYYPSYSREFAEKLNYLTWVVLKAHTRNRSGEVTLRSSDPRDAPAVNFNYFGEGGEEDLTAVVDGIRFVRTLSAKLNKQGMVEELPGERVQTDEELKEFVRSHAWGHHASCTCAIGPLEKDGVLDSGFRVHKTRNLRVVDASVFPRIPGFFIAGAIYMIGEKAAETILRDS